MYYVLYTPSRYEFWPINGPDLFLHTEQSSACNTSLCFWLGADAERVKTKW